MNLVKGSFWIKIHHHHHSSGAYRRGHFDSPAKPLACSSHPGYPTSAQLGPSHVCTYNEPEHSWWPRQANFSLETQKSRWVTALSPSTPYPTQVLGGTIGSRLPLFLSTPYPLPKCSYMLAVGCVEHSPLPTVPSVTSKPSLLPDSRHTGHTQVISRWRCFSLLSSSQR